MNRTEQYQLSQWDKSDRIMMEDFNADNEKIEQALAEVAAQAALISKCGNCKIVQKTYTGTGTYGSTKPTSLTFDAPPILVLVNRDGSGFMVMFSGNTSAKASDNSWATVSWSGNKVSWYNTANASNQYNVSNVTYTVVALLAAN